MSDISKKSDSAELNWIRSFEKGLGAKYIQIADMLNKSIQSGSLQVGQSLPAQRLLAQRLGVDLTTVTRAYNLARDKGLIDSYPGKGSYVAATPATAPARLDLTMNVPPQLPGGKMSERIIQDLREVLHPRSLHQVSNYQNDQDWRAIQQAAQLWLKPALPSLDLNELVVCNGSQAGLFAILMANSRPGDRVMCEALTYPGLITAAEHLGVSLVPIELDEAGPVPEAIERAHADTGAGVLYLNPTFHNPTTYVMPDSRRAEIAAVLRRLDLTLIEDDPYRNLLPEAPPPIAQYINGENTYYLASLSKCLWPGLRTGFLVPPRGQASARLTNALRATSMGCSGMLARLVETWIRTGMAEQLVAEVRLESQARQRIARTALGSAYTGDGHGLHVWLPLSSQWTSASFANALDQLDVQVASADSFAIGPTGTNAVRISLGAAGSRDALSQGLGKLGKLLRENRPVRPTAFV